MHGKQEGVRLPRGLLGRPRSRVSAGIPSEFPELLLAARVAEDHLMPGTREERAEFAPHQSRTQNANSHAVLPTFCRSATAQLLQLFGVASSLHRDFGGGAVDVTEIVGRQFD